MNKSLITNLLAAAVLLSGLLLPDPWRQPLLLTGLFSLAGALTNWIAIHMLFERVPFLYGSGVITARFAEFKSALQSLVMQQFFSQANVDRFFAEMMQEHGQQRLDFSDVIEHIDLSPAYDSLVATISESSFGSVLSMFGGQSALEPLREPFTKKMRKALDELAHSQPFQQSLQAKLSSASVAADIHQHIEAMVAERLEQLTPAMVKDIIQQMIRRHLGWLVVWGGVFGGLIGLLSSFVL